MPPGRDLELYIDIGVAYAAMIIIIVCLVGLFFNTKGPVKGHKG